MTGNAHEESCHKLLSIHVREQGLYIIKTDCSGKIMVAFEIKEKAICWQAYFANLCCPFPIYSSGVKFVIWLRYWSYFQESDKSGYCSLFIFSFINCYGLLIFS